MMKDQQVWKCVRGTRGTHVNGIIATRALAHKLARASYHVMRDHVDFDPEKTFA
jgi:hypothetical protein